MSDNMDRPLDEDDDSSDTPEPTTLRAGASSEIADLIDDGTDLVEALRVVGVAITQAQGLAVAAILAARRRR